MKAEEDLHRTIYTLDIVGFLWRWVSLMHHLICHVNCICSLSRNAGLEAARRESEEQEMQYMQRLKAAERSRDEARQRDLASDGKQILHTCSLLRDLNKPVQHALVLWLLGTQFVIIPIHALRGGLLQGSCCRRDAGNAKRCFVGGANGTNGVPGL